MAPSRCWGWSWLGLEPGGLLQAGRELDFERSQAGRSPENQVEEESPDRNRTHGTVLAGQPRLAHTG
jgi:hypothetical protein